MDAQTRVEVGCKHDLALVCHVLHFRNSNNKRMLMIHVQLLCNAFSFFFSMQSPQTILSAFNHPRKEVFFI